MLYSGGGSFIKGFHIVISGLAKLLTKHKCKVYITFGRTIAKKQERLLHKLKEIFHKEVIILGRIPYKRVLALHSRLWALLHPSIWEEPLPYTVIESCLLRTIPLASKVGGVLEIVGNTVAKNFLHEPGNLEDFIDKVERIFTLSKDQILDIGSKLRESVLRKLDLELIRKKLLQIFYQL